MKPAPFTHHRPDSIDEAVSLLDRYDQAKVLAGNQSLGIAMARRIETPDHLIDLSEIDKLAFVETTPSTVRVGAMTKHRTIEHSDRLAQCLPMLPDAGGKIAGPSVRNQGTIGGSLANADPAGNFPTALKALGGTVTLRSNEGTRDVDSEEFFIDDGITACQSNEIIQSISVPRKPFPIEQTGMAFVRLKRAAQKWPIVSAATAIRVDNPDVKSPMIKEARIALANAGPIPLRVSAAEEILEGGELTNDQIQAVIDVVSEITDPSEEMHADSTYRTEVAGEYARRSLEQSYARARNADEIPWTEH